MCKKLLFLLVVFALCPTAMASDVAISTEISWIGQAAADREAQEIADNVTGADVQIFPTAQGSQLATWVQDHTGDGTPDILILFGRFPTSIYPGNNGQPDGSIAENFLDDGNCIINTADWMFYVSNGGNNAAAGLQNMMDAPSADMSGAGENIQQTITADGLLYTPSLTALQTDRPFHLDTLTSEWEVELLLAQDSTGNLVDPVIVRNTVTDGRIGIFYQTNGQDNDPRGEVISEWINNWFIPFVATGNPYARGPDPKDGEEIEETGYTLKWTKGDFAEKHDVYIGTDQTAVTNATTTSPEYYGSKDIAYFVVGYNIPGAAYPAGLEPGTTYYWRVDEVKDGDPNSPWKGKTWSFSLPAEVATEPSPADGQLLVSTTANLTWKSGWRALWHEVFFSTDYDTVANAVAGDGKTEGAASFNPPEDLLPSTTYYWRVDETSATGLHPGAVWSFTTESGKPGGLLGQYYTAGGGTPAPFEPLNLLLTRIDQVINFNWGDGSPDAAIDADGFAARWTGEITIPLTDTWTFYGRSDDGMRIWVGGQLVMDAWVDRGTTETNGQITLAAGNYPIQVDYYENGGGATCYLDWSSPHIAKANVPEKALSPPLRASAPNPANGATQVSRLTDLEWVPGYRATSHDVYFGTDATAVANATKTSLEYKGNQILGDESFDPGPLDLAQTYYWRVDENNNLEADSPWIGNLWSFTVGDFIVIDDFEDYNDTAPDRVFDKWFDGTIKSKYGNSQVGYWWEEADLLAGEHFLEDSIVNGGDWSMPYLFNGFSEARLTMSQELRNWTQDDVKVLSLWYQGHPQSPGSFVETAPGAYTMTATGNDIWGTEDQCHFAYKMLQGQGSITALASSITGAGVADWAKAGVMIRETLDPDSTNAFVATTTNQGVNGQVRMDTGGTTVQETISGAANRPIWIRVERDVSGDYTGLWADDVGGVPGSWSSLTPVRPSMLNSPVYIGFAAAPWTAGNVVQITFSNITTTGNVTGAWASTDIGIQSNPTQPMYVTLEDGQGRTATVNNPDPDVAQVPTWTEWGEYGQGIALSDFVADNPSFNLADVNSILIGFGAQSAGSGLMYFDDIRLYKPRCIPDLVKPATDFNNDCVVDMLDLEILTNNWLISNYEVTPADPGTAGLVVHYQFQNNLLDSSGNGNNGTATGTPAYAAGQVGQALDLDGATSITGGNIGITGAAPRTISGWARATVPPAALGGGGWTNVFGLSGPSAGGQHFDIERRGNQDTYCIHVYGWEANIMPLDQEWHHFAATYDGTTVKAYGDGHLAVQSDRALNTTGVMQVGKRDDNSVHFTGLVDEVRVYDRALMQDEIGSLAGRTAAYMQDLALLLNPADASMDANADGAVDFADYAVLIDAWLDEVLWP